MYQVSEEEMKGLLFVFSGGGEIQGLFRLSGIGILGPIQSKQEESHA